MKKMQNKLGGKIPARVNHIDVDPYEQHRKQIDISIGSSGNWDSFQENDAH
jgi:hypothetical protein